MQFMQSLFDVGDWSQSIFVEDFNTTKTEQNVLHKKERTQGAMKNNLKNRGKRKKTEI